MQKLINIVRRCHDFASLYLLENELNDVGLTIQPILNNRMALCKVVNGKPQLGKITEDFMYVGSRTSTDNEIPKRLLDTIVEFTKKINKEHNEQRKRS